MNSTKSERKLKDYTIKTKIELGEVRHRIKKGCVYEQPLAYYYLKISRGYGWMTQIGGLKSMKEVIKALKKEL